MLGLLPGCNCIAALERGHGPRASTASGLTRLRFSRSYPASSGELGRAGEQVHGPFPLLVFVSGSDRWKPLCTDNDDIGGVVIVERRGHPVPPRERWEKKFRDDPLRIVIPAAANTAAFSSTDLNQAVLNEGPEAARTFMGEVAASEYASLIRAQAQALRPGQRARSRDWCTIQ